MATKYEPSPTKLIVTVQGGLVQAIEGGPPDLEIEVWDFDADDDRAEVNEKGESFWRTVWREG